MDNNIKDYREKELKNYVIGNALIITVLSGIFDTLFNIKLDETTSNIILTLGSEIISAGIFSSILYSYVFILDAIVPGNWKDLVCNLNRPLPGQVIFEEIKEKANDNRFTKENALQKYADIYGILDNLTGKERRGVSNSAWYSIYLKHENKTKISISQRDYLLCRDLCVSTLYIGLLYFALWAFSIIAFDHRIVALLIVELIATNFAMRGKQKRFAYNVIAIDIHTPKESHV